MEELYYVLMGIVPMVMGGLGAIVFIVVVGQIIKARMSAVSKRSFESLANELREENTKLLTELTAMKENLSSINKMMKEIE